jgi:hypothetical protein
MNDNAPDLLKKTVVLMHGLIYYNCIFWYAAGNKYGMGELQVRQASTFRV